MYYILRVRPHDPIIGLAGALHTYMRTALIKEVRRRMLYNSTHALFHRLM